ncbi:MAG: DNA polymerase I [Candidatus Kerfeldbacteria bacterium]
MATKEKFLLVDAHALIHRAFHALPPLTTSNGQQINAVYGFLLIMLRALKDIDPTYVAIAFDSKGKTFRHKQYKEYKATRPPAPDELKSQFPIVREAVEAFGFTSYALEGYEADDLIGTVCEQMEKRKDLETIIVTGDMDLLQLVDDNTKVLKLQRGVKDTLLYDPKMVEAKHGLTPEQIVEYKGLRGDSSDNIPGVKGIGEKSATELLKKYKTIDGIFDHLADAPSRAIKALEGHKDDAELSRELATIAKDAPIKFTLKDAKIDGYDSEAITSLFQKYEFKALLAQLRTLPHYEEAGTLFAKPSKKKTEPAEPVARPFEVKGEYSYHLVQSEEEIKELAEKLSKQKIFGFDTETTGLNPISDKLVGMSFSWKTGEAYYLACGEHIPGPIAQVMVDDKIKKTGQNVKFDIEVVHHAGSEVNGVVFDTMIASYLMNAGTRGHGLDNLAFVEFGHQMQPIEDLIGKGKKQISMAEVDVNTVTYYASEDADYSWRLYEKLSKRLKEQKMEKLFNDIELPTITSLVAMEEAGVKINEDFLNDMSKKMHRRINELELNIHKSAGKEFNVASNVQLKEVLYEKLGLSTHKIKKTKTGFSTQASELEKLRGMHPIIDMISEYRELAKLTSTYIDTLPELVNPETGRIHTSFNQTITATGRLSSSDPNLQNIPIRTELGKEIRKAFIPERGNRIVSLDYSQVELRIVAHLADDKTMKEAFKRGEDIHTRTAAELNDVPLEKVTPEMRRQAKAINFGIIYGMGVQGIMRDSGISRDEAQMFLEKYFTVHSGIKLYIDKVKQFARDNKYAETIFGRRRPLPEIDSGNRMLQAAAERAAINLPVQGASSDIMKLAMNAVQAAIDDGKIDALMILQVHDELVFEIDKEKIKSEAKKIASIMDTIVKLDVPLEVDIEAGPNWGDLKDV